MWLRLMSILLPLFFWNVVVWLHRLAVPAIGLVILSAVVVVVTLFSVRLFRAADDQFIHIYSDRIEWSVVMGDPLEARLPLEQIEELIIYQTAIQEVHGANAALKLTDGRLFLLPVITGSITPILSVIRSLKPDLKETLEVGAFDRHHSRMHWNFLLNGKRP